MNKGWLWWCLPEVYDRNAHAFSQKDTRVLYRIGEVVHQGKDVPCKLAIMFRGVVLLSIVHSHGPLSQSPLLVVHRHVGGVRRSLENTC